VGIITACAYWLTVDDFRQLLQLAHSITQAAVDYFFAAERDPNHPLLVHLISTVLREEILSHAGTYLTLYLANACEEGDTYPRAVLVTEDESTLFRSKTNGSKMLSLCLRICCMNYLKDAIGPVIARVCAEAPAVEIDPSRYALQAVSTALALDS
jgi:hypothetical protein